ncbi:MAG: permease-like cell division protein FtsX [Acidimicrobiales bacterium]
MALKVTYMLRETGTNLVRRISLTIAAILTISISLALFGSSLLARDGVANATQRWEGGIEFVIWMIPDADADQDAAIRRAIDESPAVASFTYVNQDEAFVEFSEMFADSPELIESVEASDLPPSYRVVPTDPDADVVAELGRQFDNRPGVRNVVFASEAIKDIQLQANRISSGLLWVSIALLVASALLILNTIVVAINARRKEIEVMKLVGASNWFIRLPFMLEGLVHGLVGSGFAVVAMWGVKRWVIDGFSQSQNLKLLEGLRVTTAELINRSLWVLGIGVIVGILGSAFAVSTKLDV